MNFAQFSISILAACLFALAAAGPVQAQYTGPYCDQVICRTVVASIDDLRNMDTSNNAAFGQISVTCYHAATADVLCAGGGDFDRVKYVHLVAPCSSTLLDNGVTLIQDQGHNCFYRKNFGLNGVADARQCGIYGDGTHDDTDALNNCLNVAAQLRAPMLPNGLRVATGGGRVRIDGGASGRNVLLQTGTILTCGGASVEADDNNYTDIPHAIWLYNKSDGTVLHSITGANKASSVGVDGCLILRSNSQAGGPNFDYAPNAFVPASMRESLSEVSHFVGTAIVANTSSFTVTNSTILGFATCIKGTRRHLTVENMLGDCKIGFDLKTPDAPSLSNCRIERLLSAEQR